ncbi:hypothetical protein LCGC14_1589860 [marine sediment metagenome]|uniref:Uncharacterized protein n=1 Tax=marine sediment metagenome TaxID=412755 RepID=A0A0F9IE77_9ZZZZ
MSSFRAIVNLDEDGDVTCFCPYENYLKGNCKCRNKFDCPEAMIDITILPKSRPSEQAELGIKKITRELKKSERTMKKANDRIKQGLSQLEKATKGTRWRI